MWDSYTVILKFGEQFAEPPPDVVSYIETCFNGFRPVMGFNELTLTVPQNSVEAARIVAVGLVERTVKWRPVTGVTAMPTAEFNRLSGVAPPSE